MARERMMIVYREKGGKPISYRYLPFSESLRAEKILAEMSEVNEWIPVSLLSQRIECNRHCTARTVDKLVGAVKIKPDRHGIFLLIKNAPRNPKANLTGKHYLKSTTYVCAHLGDQ